MGTGRKNDILIPGNLALAIAADPFNPVKIVAGD
jgi:hypothetical protein